MLLILPLSSVADPSDDRDIVVFKLYLNHKHWGVVNVLCDSTKYYINLPELLTQLEYKHDVDYQQKNFKGYLSEVDSTSFTITGDSSHYSLWSDAEEFFLESSEIEKRYDFKFEFTFGSLALDLITKKGVPIVLRRLREEKRIRMAEQKAALELTNIDTLRPKVFNLNSVGYALNANVGTFNQVSFNGNSTGEAFRGTYLLNYEISDNRLPWSNNVRVDWQKPFLNKKWLKTLRVFHDINNMYISSNSFQTGVMLSNEDRNDGFMHGHVFQGRTTPNTDVEIYNNGQLIQYLKSDSLGNYLVEIPSYEGENNIRAVSYDSFGTPVIDESMVYLPPGLQEKKKFVYVASAGVNDCGEFFSNLSGEYGLLSNLTLGVANQTLFKYGDIKSIVEFYSKYTIRNHVRLDLNYIPAVRFSSMLTGNVGTRFSGNITYENYNKKQNVICANILENFIASINGSLPMKSVTGNYYVSAQYYKFGRTNNYSTLLSMNFWWQKISGTLSFNSVSQKMKLENAVYEARVGYRFNNKIYNELAVYYRSLSKSFNARNRFNYQFSNKLNAYCDLNYNTRSKTYNVSLGVSWRLPWVQFRGGMHQSKYATSAFATVSGSMLLYENMDRAFTHRFVSGASLQIVPFLDINGNGEMDKHEPVMSDSKLVIHTGADMQKTKKGIFFNNIPPNRGFKVIVPRQAYEDITWQIEPQEICLVLAPYQSRTIHIPVKILTELAGLISVDTQGQTGVMDGMPITITNLKTGNITHIRSDDWGYYSSMVVCGEYTIELDAKTLEQAGVTCANPVRHITIESSREGQQLIDLHFVCTAKPTK